MVIPHPDVITLGHSPDPDDAFMFYALAENKIDTRGYRFEHILQDIETLNQRAMRGELHISAISIGAYAYVLDKYALLPSGASMGEWLKPRKIAVPGVRTSAFLALRLYLPDFEYEVVPFDRIFEAVQSGRADAGLIIHEGQLTYARDGFAKVVDLGEWWKGATGLPLPLGGNIVRKDLEREVRRELSDILRESIDYGLAHRAEAVAHSMPLARGLDVPMADKFIGMYVNDYTRDYGEVGRRAIHEFLGAASEHGFIPAPVGLEFVE
jgi:1,4-dihydroxy-6-naphthoate synthase